MLKDYLKDMSVQVDDQIQKFLPEQFTKEWIEEHLGELKYGVNDTINPLTIPIWDLLNRGGKRWRPVFMMLCCDALNGGSKVMDLIPVIELLHNGTLLVDDIQDDSIKRRGDDCIHRKYGVDVAINAGNMMYYLPYMVLRKINLGDKTKLRIHEVVAEEMMKLHLGQGMDINWHNGKGEVTEEAYMQMSAFKTGTLPRMAARIGALLGKATPRQKRLCIAFAESIGIAFQIQDDILNITNKEWGKDFGDDISEGKRTLMVLHTLNNAGTSDENRLLNILDSNTRNERLIEEAIGIMEKYNSINYARNKAREIVEEAWKALDKEIPDSSSKKKLELFGDYVVKRNI